MNTKVHRYTSFVLTLGLVVLVSGCSATVNWNYPRTPSTAFASSADHHPRCPLSGSRRATPRPLRLLRGARKRARVHGPAGHG